MKGYWNRGTCTKWFHYQKRCTFKGTCWKSKPVCLQTFLFKTSPLRNTKKYSDKIPTSLTCPSCFGMALCCFWNYFFYPLVLHLVLFSSRVWFPASQGCSRHTQASLPGSTLQTSRLGDHIGVRGHPTGLPTHHLEHWDVVSLSFLSRAAKKRCRCSFTPLERDLGKPRQIVKTRIFFLEWDPCSDTCPQQERGRGLGPDCRVRFLVWKMDGQINYRATKITRNKQQVRMFKRALRLRSPTARTRKSAPEIVAI